MNEKQNTWALYGLFFFSGAAALLYQAVWIKRLSLEFGHSAWAVSTVVGVFMAGLGLGSWFAGRTADRIKNPVRLYGWIELGVAAFGLLSWPLLNFVPSVLAPAYPHPPLFSALRLIICFLVLLPPTLLMGASLPILVVGVSGKDSFSKAIGVFYGLNTLGSAFGALAAGFLLMPWLGVRATLFVAVGMGLAIAALAIWRVRGVVEDTLDVVSQPDPTRHARLVPLLALMCGFFGLFLEIAWTRLLAPVLGSSTYTFSIILFVILAGTAAGSLMVSRLSFTPARCFSVSCALLGAAAVFGLAGLPLANALPALFVRMAPLTQGWPAVFFLTQMIVVALLVIGPTLTLGMAMPCLVNARRGSDRERGKALGTVYAMNTLGAIAGCFITGFVLLPRVGVSQSVIGVCAATLGLVALFLLFDEAVRWRRRMIWSASGVLAAISVFYWWPQVDLRHLHTGFFRAAMKTTALPSANGDLIYIKDGISSTVAIYRSPDQTALKINGKTDASTAGDLNTQYLLGHLPMFFHANPKRVCVIGYGSGATTRAVLSHSPRVLDVVELEPAVIQTSEYFRSINESVLDDPRVRLHIEDGRTFLSYGKGVFDVIISEPSNPWIAGVSSLFTREFYEDSKSRLAPGGVFCQWIQIYELSRPTLDAMVQTLHETFPYVAIFAGHGDFICLASDQPITTTSAALSARLAAPEVKRSVSKIGITTPADLLVGYYSSLPEDTAKFVASERNTDDNSWLEFRAPLEMYAGHTPTFEPPAISAVLDRLAQRFSPDISKDNLALGLADSIRRLRPFALYRIDAMAALFGNDTQVRLKKISSQAAGRVAVLGEADQSLARAVNLLSDQKPQQARQVLARLEEVDPHYPGLQRTLGSIAMRSDDWEQAVIHFNAALGDNPNDYVTLSELGAGWLAQANVPAAIACFKRAVEANPVFEPAWMNLERLLGPDHS